MKLTRGVVAAVVAALFATLVAVGVGFAVRGSGERVVGGDRPRQSATTPPAPSSPAGTAGSPGGPSAAPTVALPTLLPEPQVTFTARPSRKPPKKPTKPPTPEPPPVLDFTLSSFNVLGASHTSGSGKRPGMASGRVRAGRASELVRRHGSDVVGFQELQAPQLATLQRRTSMEFWPGFAMGSRDTENSIGWRSDVFTAVEKRVVRIPYFNGSPRAMPVVKLRDRRTGVEAWFANFHNPADTSRFHRQQRFRDQATAIEVRLANELVRTGLPVFITGDMNERDSYFCRMTGGAPMVAARGGSHNGSCQPGNPRAVDWIFGSQGVTFTGYYEDRSHLVDITTDHPVVVARVRVVGESD